MRETDYYKNQVIRRNEALAVLAILLFALSTFAQTIADVDATVQKLVDSKTIPGAAVAIVRDGKVVLTKAYGAADIEAKVSADENTKYEIGSVTKQFTAEGIMMLVEDGKVNLEDSVVKYLLDVPEIWKSVTVRQLLNQVSGIKNYTAVNKIVLEKEYTAKEILDMVRDLPLEFEPGTKWQYSNTNYYLLGLIIEKASGKSYADFMKERIFKPLGMNSTFVNTSGLKIEKKAAGYSPNKDGWHLQAPANPTQPFAAGAIVSTAADMAKWEIALETGKLLNKNSYEQMWTSGKLADGKLTNYGFGWQVSKIGEVDFFGHNGGIAGFSSQILRFPKENLSVAVLVNGATRETDKLAYTIAGLYLPKVAEALAEREKKVNETAADTDEATTKFLRETLEKFAAGEDVKDRFTPDAQANLFPDKAAQLKGLLSNFGAIKSFELVMDETIPQGKRRSYRVSFAAVKVRFTFAVTPEGKIASLALRPE